MKMHWKLYYNENAAANDTYYKNALTIDFYYKNALEMILL